jgi:hypothetical protein
MSKVKVDFTGVEAYVKCAEGEHVAVLKSIEEKESQGGNDMLAATFEVVAGPSSGARVFDNFPLTEKALWKLKMYLEAIGMKADGKVAIDTDKMVGKKLIISVSHEEYQGQTRARIQGYKKMGESSKPKSEAKASEEDASNEDDGWDEA